MKLVFDQDAAVAEWVTRRIEHIDQFGPYVAIGVADGDKPIAGAVFNEWQPKFNTMEISVAADSPRWAQRGIIRGLLSYPFEQQGVRKLWSIVVSSNARALRFNKGVGFKQEAILSRHFGRDHAIITRMFVQDYHRLYGKGQVDERIRAA